MKTHAFLTSCVQSFKNKEIMKEMKIDMAVTVTDIVLTNVNQSVL